MHASADPKSPQRPAREAPPRSGHSASRGHRPPPCAQPSDTKAPAGATSAGASGEADLEENARATCLESTAPRMPRRPFTSPRRWLPSLSHPRGASHLPTPPQPGFTSEAAEALRLPQPGLASETRREPGELRGCSGATPHSLLLLLPHPSGSSLAATAAPRAPPTQLL